MKTVTLAIRSATLAAAASLVLAFSCPMLAVAAAKGSVSYQGQTWNVVEAIAYGNGVNITLAFSKIPWDREAWAGDGVFDEYDAFKRERGASELHLELALNARGELSRVCMIRERGLVEGCIWDARKALSLQSFGQEHVQGSFKLTDADHTIDLSFDLDVLKVGTVLP